MDYAAAENAAKQALRLSRISGHLRSEFAAIIDLAHVWIQFGRLDDAGRMLRRASNMCDLSPRCRDCVRDGLAQLELHRGNLGSSRHLVDEVLASTSPRHAYPRVWGALTKAEMLLRQGLYQECQAQCEAALAALPVPTDKGLALRSAARSCPRCSRRAGRSPRPDAWPCGPGRTPPTRRWVCRRS